MALPLAEQTLAELLAPAGYTSACIGKWHLGGAGFGPREQGFTTAFAGTADTKPSATEGGKGEYGLTEKAIDFIEQNKSRPFFLYLPHNNPHVPLAAQRDRVEKNRGAFNPLYAAMVETLDDSVGRILAKLDESGLATSTIVIFTSDNGGLHVLETPNTPATHNTPFRAGKGYVYEGGLRVPLLVRWPGKVKAGSIISMPVSIADLMPTLLELAGAPLPANLDFISLRKLLLGEGEIEPRTFFWHLPHYTNQGGRPAGAVREGEWKLIEHYEDGRAELFHLGRDPGENHDLSAQDAGRVAAMRGKLAAWREEVGAQENTPNPDFEPAKARPCYAALDASNLSASATAAEMATKLEHWRKVMNDAVAGGAVRGTAGAAPPPPLAGPAGFIVLRARDAQVHGEKLRYEPQPQKNTLGYWTRVEDWVSWDFEVKHPGRYEVALLQGCGSGSGGAAVEIRAGEQALEFTVTETGHFQNFIPRTVGVVTFAAGRGTLSVIPKTKPGAAVMDLRQVMLTRVAD